MHSPGNKQVLVIGARGVLGALVVGAFEDEGWAVRQAARRPNLGEVFIDLDQPETIAAEVSEDELIINAVAHRGLAVERTVLERGGALINISALPAAAGRALRAIAGDARGTVMMNAGLAPGVTNLAAAELLTGYPQADELEMVFMASATAPRGPASADFVHRGLTGNARHRTALIPLPEPFGERCCLGFCESDAGWLGGLAEDRVIRPYLCIVEPEAHQRMLALNARGELSKLPRSAVAAKPPAQPGKASQEPVAHWVAASRRGQRLAALTVECEGDFVNAARSTVVFARAQLERRQRPGCFDPEEVFVLNDLEPTLHAAGIRIVRRSRHGTLRTTPARDIGSHDTT
jgi:hypothetical protein